MAATADQVSLTGSYETASRYDIQRLVPMKPPPATMILLLIVPPAWRPRPNCCPITSARGDQVNAIARAESPLSSVARARGAESHRSGNLLMTPSFFTGR